MHLDKPAAKIAWDYVYEKVDGKEAARRLGKATTGTAGGLAINHGVATLVEVAAKQSLGPVGQFACTVAGNMLGNWLAEKFIEFLDWIFAKDPMDGYRRACQELGVAEDTHRREIKKAYAKCHPDKGSGLTTQQFEEKTIAFHIIKATKNRQNTWDDDE